MKKGQMLTNTEIASFCEQMAMVMKAGITPKDGLAILLSDTKDESTREILQTLLNSSALGETFTTSVKSSGVFPDYVVNMIAIGEETGRVDDVMQSLSDYYEHEENIAETKKVVEYAHARNVTVEAELGKIMGTEDLIPSPSKPPRWPTARSISC